MNKKFVSLLPLFLLGLLLTNGCSIVESTNTEMDDVNISYAVVTEAGVSEGNASLTVGEDASEYTGYSIDLAGSDTIEFNDFIMTKRGGWIFPVTYNKSITSTSTFVYELTIGEDTTTCSVENPPAITIDSPTNMETVSGMAVFTITWTTTGTDAVSVVVFDNAGQMCVDQACANTDGISPSGSYELTLNEVRNIDFGKATITVSRTYNGTRDSLLHGGNITAKHQAKRDILVTETGE